MDRIQRMKLFPEFVRMSWVPPLYNRPARGRQVNAHAQGSAWQVGGARTHQASLRSLLLLQYAHREAAGGSKGLEAMACASIISRPLQTPDLALPLPPPRGRKLVVKKVEPSYISSDLFTPFSEPRPTLPSIA